MCLDVLNSSPHITKQKAEGFAVIIQIY
ncbi:hypothetical protein SB30_10027 [Klebsiella quasipneumoniae subsp. similipneumoniae]|nr:hypothetical protein SB30_10027 [Klebsiella quasipneumoniae subsp. similipneumoniae]